MRLDLLQSMAASGWKQGGAGADVLWFELALLRTQRGEGDLARTAIDRINAPFELIQLRSDRRFDGLYDPQSPRFDVARVAKERVDRLAARSAAAPDDLERLVDVTGALQVVGEYGRIVELVDALPRSGTGKIQWRTLQEREWKRRANEALGITPRRPSSEV